MFINNNSLTTQCTTGIKTYKHRCNQTEIKKFIAKELQRIPKKKLRYVFRFVRIIYLLIVKSSPQTTAQLSQVPS